MHTEFYLQQDGPAKFLTNLLRFFFFKFPPPLHHIFNSITFNLTQDGTGNSHWLLSVLDRKMEQSGKKIGCLGYLRLFLSNINFVTFLTNMLLFDCCLTEIVYISLFFSSIFQKFSGCLLCT